MPDDLGLLFHRAGGDICYDSLILRRPGYFDAAFDTPGNADLDFNRKLLNFLQMRAPIPRSSATLHASRGTCQNSKLSRLRQG